MVTCAGEISLIAALASGDLLRSHMALNRKKDDQHGKRAYSTRACDHSAPECDYDEDFAPCFPVP